MNEIPTEQIARDDAERAEYHRDEMALLIRLVRHTKAAGWTCNRKYGYPEYADAQGGVTVSVTSVFDDGFELNVMDVSWRLYAGCPRSVEAAVDVLVAVGVLDQRWSSAYAAGRESAYEGVTTEWAVSTPALTWPCLTEDQARNEQAQHPQRRSISSRQVGPWKVTE